MFFENLCVIVLRMIVASALEGLRLNFYPKHKNVKIFENHLNPIMSIITLDSSH